MRAAANFPRSPRLSHATSALENTFNAEIAEIYAENAEKISAKRANRQDELDAARFF